MRRELFLGIIAVALLATVGTVAAVNPEGPSAVNGLKHPGKASQLYLYEKDADWRPVVGGAWGKMTFNESFVFNGHGLVPETGYTLVNYCGWPIVIVMGTATADMYGDVHITGNMPTLCIEDGNAGAKIWLVESADLTGTVFNSWSPEEYLFEYNLI